MPPGSPPWGYQAPGLGTLVIGDTWTPGLPNPCPEVTSQMDPILVTEPDFGLRTVCSETPGQASLKQSWPWGNRICCPSPRPSHGSPEHREDMGSQGQYSSDRWALSPPPQGLHGDSGAGGRHPEQHGPAEQQRRRPGRQGPESLPRAQAPAAGVRGAQWVAVSPQAPHPTPACPLAQFWVLLLPWRPRGFPGRGEREGALGH